MPATAPAAESAKRKPSMSRTRRAKLIVSVSRVQAHIRRVLRRVGAGAPVYLAAVAEYIVAEVLELAAKAAKDNKRTSVRSRDIMLAIRGDEELSRFFAASTVAGGGVVPNVHRALLPKTKKGRATATTTAAATTTAQQPSQ